MREGQTINEPQFQHNDATPAPEEKVASKLAQLNPQDLIPPELANIPEVSGSMKVVARESDGHIDFLIIGDKQMHLQQIKNSFTYFKEDKLEKYPELTRDEDQDARTIAHGSISQISPDILFGGMFETNPALRGKGVGVAFQEHLANLATKLGYKFLAGYQNDAEIARFFLNRGRYLLEEIKDELQAEFQSLRDQEPDETVFYTVKFLDPEDIARYVKPERIDTDIDDKIEFKQKILTLGDVFYKLATTLKKVEDCKEELGDRAKLI